MDGGGDVSDADCRRTSPMTTRAFQQVDVFTGVPFTGNPVAVVLDGDGLSTTEMQAIAHWTNLSETTFVCTPDDSTADYRLRIFTKMRELPFAGHPTIGSAHAVLRHGRKPRAPGRLVQQCGKGLVALRLEGDRIFLALPEPAFREPSAADVARAAEALGLGSSDVRRASIIDVGPVWFTLQLAEGATVLELTPDMGKLAALPTPGINGVNVFGLYPDARPADVEVRSFAPAGGTPEDPVCGSGNGCVAALIRREKILAVSSYAANQGRCLSRNGRVDVELADNGVIWLGGRAVTCVEGTLRVA
jgi:PhzF family phenazine biosynthesis protein